MQLRTLTSGSTSTPEPIAGGAIESVSVQLLRCLGETACVPKIVMPPTRSDELMSGQPSMRLQRPTLQCSARMLYMIQARSLISLSSRMIECLMRTPCPILTLRPIVTFGPIYQMLTVSANRRMGCMRVIELGIIRERSGE